MRGRASFLALLGALLLLVPTVAGRPRARGR